MHSPKAYCLALALLATTLAAALQLREDPITEGKRFLPTKPGTVMIYSVRNNGVASTLKYVARGFKPNKPYPVMEFHREPGRHSRYEYWMASPEGLRMLDSAMMSDEPGFTVSPDRGVLLPLPLRKGMSWKWEEAFRGQTMSGPDGEPPVIPPTKYSGRVVDVDTSVKVPAGAYRAAVVEITTTYGERAFMTRTFWVKDVGIVKRETFDVRGVRTGIEELASVIKR